ncbi:MAG: chromosomal replication initiator protein DnaA [SAR324 cluster bacterium]|uniref:Chromosomal replication initiator protein DnaA n=1 Tax=SAR324 cluster bacterium TaxID=2024889 RepID=A0A2A4TA93_9DELT|nr:MAG: chromosomal replication initiator protein DnaA [SAR324 cluster bacterium]
MTSDEQIIQCWNQFIHFLNQHLDPDEIEAWGSKLQLIRFQPDNVIIGGVNQFFCNWMRDRHQQLLRTKIYDFFSPLQINPEFQLVIQVGKEAATKVPAPKISQSTEHFNDGLNPQFRFEEFINGSNSEMSYAASMAVGENIKSNKYNPLFICGDVGLGKTHLVQAIGLRARELDPSIKIRYANSREFTNEVINGIRFGKIQAVRNKYRYVDLLIIDDIQFLENKESTQEEFFHTFNELIQNKKQIILTADRYPREMQKLQERLVNRFNSGMVARIYAPDFETRVAIIRTKVEKMKIPLNEEIINYIANAVKSNVRDLEGILVHIEASWSLLGQEISLDMTKRVLKDVLNLENNPQTIASIIQLVGDKFGVSVEDIMSNRREKEISKTRQLAMYVTREITGQTYPVIGKNFGGKNHTTVLQACKKMKELLEADPEIKQTITAILRQLS